LRVSPTGLTGGQAGYEVTPGFDEATGLGSLDVGLFLDNYLEVTPLLPAVLYVMSATPVTISQGGSGTSTVTISPTTLYAGTISLSCAIMAGPAGATDLPTCSTTQSVTLSPSVASGATTVTLHSTAAVIGQSSGDTARETAHPRLPLLLARFVH
jgi:hypothetical protein